MNSRTVLLVLCLVAEATIQSVDGFITTLQSTKQSLLRLHALEQFDESEQRLVKNAEGHIQQDRRSFVGCIGAALITAATTAAAAGTAHAADDDTASAAPKTSTDKEGVTVYKTKSGLQYIELQQPSKQNDATLAVKPRYGQLCVIKYDAYMKLPNDTRKQQFDEDKVGFLIKHGNAKMIPGLDEGIHTMAVGSTRRLIIPPKLGFVEGGLGPMPEYPWNRWKLNSLLEDMIKQRGGNLIYDVTLVKVLDDEADQGYYEDESLTTEQFEQIQNILNRKSVQTQAVETVVEDDKNTSIKNMM